MWAFGSLAVLELAVQLRGGAGSGMTGGNRESVLTLHTSHVEPERGAAEDLSCNGSVDDGNF